MNEINEEVYEKLNDLHKKEQLLFDYLAEKGKVIINDNRIIREGDLNIGTKYNIGANGNMSNDSTLSNIGRKVLISGIKITAGLISSLYISHKINPELTSIGLKYAKKSLTNMIDKNTDKTKTIKSINNKVNGIDVEKNSVLITTKNNNTPLYDFLSENLLLMEQIDVGREIQFIEQNSLVKHLLPYIWKTNSSIFYIEKVKKDNFSQKITYKLSQGDKRKYLKVRITNIEISKSDEIVEERVYIDPASVEIIDKIEK